MPSTLVRRTAAIALAAALAVAASFAAGPWFGAPALAQESGAAGGEGEEAGAAEAGESGSGNNAAANAAAPDADGDDATGDADDGLTEEEERLADIVGADKQGASGDYEAEEDDDFVPTQEVSSDQSVNFPVDI